MSVRILVALLALSAFGAAQGDTERVLVYGASGRIGGAIVEEALLRGYAVTGVTRDVSRLERFADRIDIEVGGILDRDHTAELVSKFDAVIVSVGGKPLDDVPANYIAATAAVSLVDVFGKLADDGPRLIFVGNLYTLEYEDGKTLLELGRAPKTHVNYAMYHGHQLALDTFLESRHVNWTVATPPNGFRLKGRTGNILWGGDELLRDPDGTPATISLEDYAFAIFEELDNANYVRARFNVARRSAEYGEDR